MTFDRTGLFLREQLTKTLPRIYEIPYSELWGLNSELNFHKAIGDLPLGLDFIDAYMQYDAGQMAALYDGMGNDIPVVDISLGRRSFPAAIFVQGARWNMMDVEKYRVSESIKHSVPTLNVVSAKLDAVANYFNRREHHTVLYGYPKRNIFGIFSQRNIATSDAVFTPYRRSAGAFVISTPQLYEDLLDIIWQFVNRAKLSSPAQIQMKVPPRLARRMVEIYRTAAGESTGLTIQQMLKSKELGLGIASIDVHTELQGNELNKHVTNEAGTGMYNSAFDRIVFKASTYTPQRHFYARKPLEVFRRSTMEYEQITIGSTTGIINPEPEYIWYYDFSNTLT